MFYLHPRPQNLNHASIPKNCDGLRELDHVPGFLLLSSNGFVRKTLLRKNVNPRYSPISFVSLKLQSHSGLCVSLMSLLSKICF